MSPRTDPGGDEYKNPVTKNSGAVADDSGDASVVDDGDGKDKKDSDDGK